MILRVTPTVLLLAAGTLLASEPKEPIAPLEVSLGPLTLKPSGFLDVIGQSRSATTADSVSTKFGNIPLGDGPGESLWTARHSRMMLKGDLPAGPVAFSGYLESDFMNFTPGQSPYHWRQYWGQARIGKWEILGGQAWSLLRANRVGTESDQELMNTDVVDPAYHTGLVGSRVRQIRVARGLGLYKAVVAWESDGNLLTKIVRDKERQHYEVGGFGGRFGRRGVTASAAVNLTARLRVVTQQYWSKRAAYQALGVVPAGANGASTLEGLELALRNRLELFSYGGLVYASRMDLAKNRLVRQWTAGLNQRIAVPSLHSGLLLSIEYSHLDRAIWSGGQGAMDFLMYRVRYTFN